MNDQDKAELYRSLEGLMTSALNKARGSLSEQDAEDVQEYIDHGEYGVAWELLWHIVNEKKLEASEELISCGKKMNLYVD